MSTVLEVRKLSKRYQLRTRSPSNGMLREFLAEGLQDTFRTIRNSWRNGSRAARVNADWFWALRDISFEVQEGDVIGIIGPNGAGKSTLLKILSRITDPSEGYARLKGRLSSLLEVGTGFHPELTGRENIYLRGAILGMGKAEIRSKFDEIVAFAGTERFLDTPVKRYSEGMYVRLAFAVAAHLDPEILLVDEVLAVGDVAFQRKCLRKMSGASKSGRTVLFVSHNMAAVENLCHRVMVLRQGKLAFSGSAQDAIKYYLSHVSVPAENGNSHVRDLASNAGRPPNCPPLLKRLELFTDDWKPLNGPIPMGASLKARIFFSLDKPSSQFAASLGFNNLFGQRIFTAHSCFQPGLALDERVGEHSFVCEIPSFTLVPGEYKVKVGLDIGNSSIDTVEEAAHLSVVESDYYGTGRVPWNGAVVLKHNWRLT